MVRTHSIEFDVEAAKALADAKDWDLTEWAKQADVSLPTLRAFLAGSSALKNSTVDDIVRPLGRTAVELIRPNGKKAGNGKKK